MLLLTVRSGDDDHDNDGGDDITVDGGENEGDLAACGWTPAADVSVPASLHSYRIFPRSSFCSAFSQSVCTLPPHPHPHPHPHPTLFPT